MASTTFESMMAKIFDILSSKNILDNVLCSGGEIYKRKIIINNVFDFESSFISKTIDAVIVSGDCDNEKITILLSNYEYETAKTTEWKCSYFELIKYLKEKCGLVSKYPFAE